MKTNKDGNQAKRAFPGSFLACLIRDEVPSVLAIPSQRNVQRTDTSASGGQRRREVPLPAKHPPLITFPPWMPQRKKSAHHHPSLGTIHVSGKINRLITLEASSFQMLQVSAIMNKFVMATKGERASEPQWQLEPKHLFLEAAAKIRAF